MRYLSAALFTLLALPATAAELSSQYTRLDHETDCRLVQESSEGDWWQRVCPGAGGASYLISHGDGRETVTYGAGSEPGMPSFGAFNYAHGTVEWRMGKVAGSTRPVAAIQRWYLANGEGEWTTQILVVSKVAQNSKDGACVVGYVSANEGAAANLRARALSDAAASFRCGRDQPVVEAAIRRHVPPS